MNPYAYNPATALMAPFYVGQKVKGSDKVPSGSRIKRGQPYIVSHCEYKENPANKGCWFWYVGVEGCDNNWMAPYLFTPTFEDFKYITFKEVAKEEMTSVN